MTSTHRLSVFAVALLVPLLAASGSLAKKRAAILPFSGPKASRVHKSVTAAFKRQGRVEIVSAKVLWKAAKELGYSRRDLGDKTTLAIVATEARLDAIVKGSVSKKGRKSSLTLRVIDGGTGDQLGRHSVALYRGRADKAVSRRIVNVAIPSILKGQYRSAPEPEVSDDPLPYPDPNAPPPPPADYPGYGDPYDGYVGMPPALGYETRAGPGPGGGNLLLQAGLISLSRTYELTGGTTEAGKPLPHKYESGFNPGVWARAEWFPFGEPGERGGAAGIGFEGYLDIGMLESDIETADGKTKGIKTTQRMAGLGLVYRMIVSDLDSGPFRVRALVGYHSATFALDEATTLYRRNDYDAFRLGADAFIPVARSEEWVWSLRSRIATLVTSGKLNEREKYAPTLGTGWELLAGVDLDLGGAWAISADYRRYSFPIEFDETGGNPALKSDDLYHGFVVQLSYRD